METNSIDSPQLTHTYRSLSVHTHETLLQEIIGKVRGLENSAQSEFLKVLRALPLELSQSAFVRGLLARLGRYARFPAAGIDMEE